ncbi:hypothetical protein FACS189473_0430 [Spirochaetia bacterium]|nr:hypothetical protein FACS189473_0430 [Spirochaetia bacterium]
MTNKKNLLFALFPVFLFASCVITDPSSTTVIEISNSSSHNLRLSFERVNYSSYYLFDTDINKNQSVSVEESSNGAVIAYDPNFELKSVKFSNLDTGAAIVEKPAKGLFAFKSGTKIPTGGENAVYVLEITDKMLE